MHLTAGARELGRVIGQRFGRDRHQNVPDGRGVVEHLRQQRDERVIHDDRVVLGMVGDVAELGGVEPQVEGVQHRAHGGDGEVGLQVLGVVPHQGGDPLIAGHAEAAQRTGELGRARRGLPVALTPR